MSLNISSVYVKPRVPLSDCVEKNGKYYLDEPLWGEVECHYFHCPRMIPEEWIVDNDEPTFCCAECFTFHENGGELCGTVRESLEFSDWEHRGFSGGDGLGLIPSDDEDFFILIVPENVWENYLSSVPSKFRIPGSSEMIPHLKCTSTGRLYFELPGDSLDPFSGIEVLLRNKQGRKLKRVVRRTWKKIENVVRSLTAAGISLDGNQLSDYTVSLNPPCILPAVSPSGEENGDADVIMGDYLLKNNGAMCGRWRMKQFYHRKHAEYTGIPRVPRVIVLDLDELEEFKERVELKEFKKRVKLNSSNLEIPFPEMLQEAPSAPEPPFPIPEVPSVPPTPLPPAPSADQDPRTRNIFLLQESLRAFTEPPTDDFQDYWNNLVYTVLPNLEPSAVLRDLRYGDHSRYTDAAIIDILKGLVDFERITKHTDADVARLSHLLFASRGITISPVQFHVVGEGQMCSISDSFTDPVTGEMRYRLKWTKQESFPITGSQKRAFVAYAGRMLGEDKLRAGKRPKILRISQSNGFYEVEPSESESEEQ